MLCLYTITLSGWTGFSEEPSSIWKTLMLKVSMYSGRLCALQHHTIGPKCGLLSL